MHLGKKRYFLPLGTTPKTGVGFIAKKSLPVFLMLLSFNNCSIAA